MGIRGVDPHPRYFERATPDSVNRFSSRIFSFPGKASSRLYLFAIFAPLHLSFLSYFHSSVIYRYNYCSQLKSLSLRFHWVCFIFSELCSTFRRLQLSGVSLSIVPSCRINVWMRSEPKHEQKQVEKSSVGLRAVTEVPHVSQQFRNLKCSCTD